MGHHPSSRSTEIKADFWGAVGTVVNGEGIDSGVSIPSGSETSHQHFFFFLKKKKRKGKILKIYFKVKKLRFEI